MDQTKKKRSQLFWRYMMPYLVVLSVSIVIGVITYGVAFSAQEKAAINANFALLEQNSQMIDMRIEEVRGLMRQITLDKNIMDGFTASGKTAMLSSDLFALKKQLPKYRLSNQLIREIILYSPSMPVILSSACAARDVDLFYKTYLRYEGMDAGEWTEAIGDVKGYAVWRSAMLYPDGHNAEDCLTYIQPYDIPGRPTLYMIALLDTSQFTRIYQAVNGGAPANVALISWDGRVLVDTGNQEGAYSPPEGDGWERVNIEGREFIAMYVTSSREGFRHVLFMPTERISEQMAYFRVIYVVGYGAAFLLGLGVLVIVVNSRYRSLKSLVGTAERAGGGLVLGDAYDYVAGTLSRIVDDNDVLVAQRMQEIPLLQATFFDRLLRNAYMNEEGFMRALRASDLSLPEGGGYVCVAYIAVRGDDSQEEEDALRTTWLLLSRELPEYFPQCVRIVTVERNELAIIFPAANAPQEEVRQSCMKLHQTFWERYKVRIVFGIGALRRRWTELSESYAEARVALRYRDLSQVVLAYDECEVGRYIAPLSSEQERKILELLRSGDRESVRATVKTMFSREAELRGDPGSHQIKAYVLMNMVFKLVEEEALMNTPCGEAVVREVHYAAGLGSGANWPEVLTDLLMKVMDHIEQASLRSDRRVIDQMTQLVRERYADPNLSLYTLGEAFGMTEKGVSRFFKEQTGGNFTDYVEQTRMQAALKRLTGSEEMLIKDVAESVGYGNISTFYKAFRRVYGVSPTTYKRVED